MLYLATHMQHVCVCVCVWHSACTPGQHSPARLYSAGAWPPAIQLSIVMRCFYRMLIVTCITV